MTEDEARSELGQLFDVPRGTWAALDILVGMVRAEAALQNLISANTLDQIWARHILDSAQLLRWDRAGHWIDLGSGAGFPGLVVAALRSDPVTLVETRRLRADFLCRAAEAMSLSHVTVLGTKVEAVPRRAYDVISARAFAPLPKLLALGHRLSHEETVWLLPKGRSAAAEVAAIAGSWQGAFQIHPSITDADAGIVIARGVGQGPKGGSRNR